MNGRKNAVASPPGRRALFAFTLALLCAVWLPHQLEALARRWAVRRLARVVGRTPRVTEVQLSLWPLALRLERVSIAKGLEAGAILLHPGWARGRWRPSLRQVTVERPWISLPRGGWYVSTGARPQRSDRGTQPSSGPLRGLRSLRELLVRAMNQPWRLSARDGTVRATHRHGDRELSIDLRGVYLEERDGSTYRIVSGASRFEWGGLARAGFSSASIDLSRASGRPTRFAALAGQLYLPRAAGTRLQVRALHGRYRGSGSLNVEVRVTSSPRPRGGAVISASLAGWGERARAHVELNGLPLQPFASLFAPLGLDALETLARGKLELRRDQLSWRIAADTRLQTLIIDHPLLNHQPVGPFDGRLRARLQIEARAGEVLIDELELAVGELSAQLSGRAVLKASRRYLSANVRVPPLPCQNALAALPPGFAPRLRGLGLQGDIGLEGRAELDGRELDQGLVEIALTPLSCRVSADPPAADVREILRGMTLRVPDAEGRPRRFTLGPDNPCYRTLPQLSRYVTGAFVAAEDSRFFSHRGFDGAQLRRAFLFDLQVGKAARGASTISQQLAKNAFLSHQRTIARKFQEAILTWRLEQVLSKRDILQAYLNIVEMGPGIYGVERAARRYFGRSAAELTPLQAAHLAALAPSPRPLSRRFARAAPGQGWMERLRVILRLMRQANTLDAAAEARWGGAELGLLPSWRAGTDCAAHGED